MNRQLPLVSVGVPTYNRPQQLRNCLDGLISQTYQRLEITVSDNGSPGEATREVVQELMRKDPRIKYFRHPENRGIFFNLQFVLDQATGEYFMWAADDDYRAPTFVEKFVTRMHQRDEYSIGFCDFMEVDHNNLLVTGYPEHLPLLKQFTASSRLVRLVRYFMQLETKGKANLSYGLIRRASLRNFRWCEFTKNYGLYGTDMLLVFSLLAQGKLALSNERLYRCTVGNPKDYATTTVPASVSKKFVAQFTGLSQQLHYSLQYLRIARGWARAALIICWPFKALDIFARLFVATELRNFVNRVQRRISK